MLQRAAESVLRLRLLESADSGRYDREYPYPYVANEDF